ncbi:hypothetical protein Nepgr_001108 [Nepenthes gracilis]|uniref:Uncharacterized protein n=1 Tax=Nepenthes gracilis TaxID=150966 RepID=A0AAD3RWQ9_NEPGR|nr:hypothetical protein Nepgr_001108 [Nepenthes gracilis]
MLKKRCHCKRAETGTAHGQFQRLKFRLNGAIQTETAEEHQHRLVQFSLLNLEFMELHKQRQRKSTNTSRFKLQPPKFRLHGATQTEAAEEHQHQLV